MEIGTEREAVGRRTIPLRFRLERLKGGDNAFKEIQTLNIK